MDIISYDDPVENALKVFREMSFTYGDEIPMDWFMDVFHIVPPTTIEEDHRSSMVYARYLGILKAKLLTEDKIALRKMPGRGQEVVIPGAQTGWAAKEFKDEISRAYDRANARTANIAYDKLTDQEKRENSDAVAKLSFFANRTIKRLDW